ncbi:glutamate decarboxylase [Aureibacter tunicatorum]|uniref:Glutamate decarboxylase n=1 Tax=Aureibacter tunicatorum TaxID=866807 RepID=A0AAE4BVM1_9BACT|nr:glutamate decarboxylase [Aureibacter tunicatorum]MDR6241843.1 glutamate decarboxylase [Aureibacter tunicatorum]BDD07090.1 glutamate decarboxylase [Aureibacter tunicatorum]
MTHKKVSLTNLDYDEQFITPAYGQRAMDSDIPKYELPAQSLPPRTAYDLIKDELMLDGNSRMNLATFVSTWMEPEAVQLMSETFDKNMIDKDEYPQTAELEKRCVNILARLWNSPAHEEATGCSTIGSSEACMLGGMAMKWKWRERMAAKGKATDKPNIVMGVNVQICWEKFARYWDVEARLIPMEKDSYKITAEEVLKYVDENTIGVVAIMGTTFTGEYENVKEINDALEDLNTKTGWDIPIHVDGASGAFIAPFIQPEIEWDFRLKWVKSINTSGHKYGLVYPGVGWIIWRDSNELPDDLVFNVNYLGGQMPTFAINFSRPGSQIIAQYYNFIRLGHEGYRSIQQNSSDIAQYLAKKIADLGPFQLISDGSDIPVFTFALKKIENYSLFDFTAKLRERGWLIPAYSMPENIEDLVIARIVVKEGFSKDTANLLLEDIKRAVKHFESKKSMKPTLKGGSFHH